MSDSFQIFRGSLMRLFSRRGCSPGLPSSQYFSSRIPSSAMAFSTAGASCRNRSVCAGVQKPITGSTPARLYQLRSKITTSPAAGKWGRYRWMYICDFSRSVGGGQRDDPEHPRADPLGDPLDRAPLPRGVAALEHDADPGPGLLDPLLQGHQLTMQ